MDPTLSLGWEHHQAGRLAEAGQAYRSVLIASPMHPEAHHLTAILLHDLGRFGDALKLVQRAIELDASVPEYHNTLAAICLELHQDDAAIAACQTALRLRPLFAAALNHWGNALRNAGKLAAAAEQYAYALEIEPELVAALLNLGNVRRDQERWDEAAALCEEAIQRQPSLMEAHNNLGVIRKLQGRLDAAVTCFERAIQLDPTQAQTQSNLGMVRYEQGQLPLAVTHFQAALAMDPNHANAHTNLGMALGDLGQLGDAIRHCRRACELDPASGAAALNLGNALKEQGLFDVARCVFEDAIDVHPEDVELASSRLYLESYMPGVTLARLHTLHVELASRFREQLGECTEASSRFRLQARSASECISGVQSQDALAGASGLYGEAVRDQFLGDTSGDAVALQNLDQVSGRATPVPNSHRIAITSRATDGTPSQSVVSASSKSQRTPLKLGFVSADLGRHPVGYFLVHVLENLDRQLFQTTCYAGRVVEDDLSLRLQRASHQWHRTLGLNDARLRDQILRDDIDILIDLSGHTRGNRLAVFATKPAPLQMTWMGYVGTTGLSEIDVLIADQWQLPEDAQPKIVERIARLPQGYVCYAPPEYAAEVAPLPQLRNGCVTFGSFNFPGKLNEHVIRVWSAILSAVPHSRFVARYRGLDDPITRELLLLQFASFGISRDRVALHGRCPHRDLLAAYGEVDVALDTFPYSGGLTTCEALWMGVPVITWPGETFASRHSLSHLSNVGLSELIATDEEDYVRRAVTLACDVPQLTELRATLRPRMSASPLCDGVRFTRDFETLLTALT